MDVNDDLSDGNTMKYLCNWSEKNIEKVTDPLVKGILKIYYQEILNIVGQLHLYLRTISFTQKIMKGKF